jgi:hypothetical protein
MALRAKYKVGTTVKVIDDSRPLSETKTQVFLYGEVTGIMTKKDGFAYEVAGLEGMIPECEIAAGFREITARKVMAKPAAKKAAAPKKVAAVAAPAKKMPFGDDTAQAVQ